MKRLISIVLTIVMIAAAVSALHVTTDAAVKYLTITGNGQNPVKVAVGNEIIFNVGLYAGEKNILDGQGYVEYDNKYVSFVPYTAYNKVSGEYDIDAYSFPSKIVSCGLVLNADVENHLLYNFTHAKKVDVFNDVNKHYAKFHFKAIAAGTTDISHVIEHMIDSDENRVFYHNVAQEGTGAYTVITIEPSNGMVGDANGDFSVDIMDATYMQMAAAGSATCSLNTSDLTGDNAVSLKDALYMRKYLAGKVKNDKIKAYLFTSEPLT